MRRVVVAPLLVATAACGGANTGTLSRSSFTMQNRDVTWVYARSASF